MGKLFFLLSFIFFFALSFLPGRSFMIFEYNCVFKLVWIATIFFALYVCLHNLNMARKFCYPITRYTRSIFILLLLSILCSTIFSEFKDVAWFCVMPILSSLSLGYLCYNYLVLEENLTLTNVARVLGFFFFLIFLWSILLYIASDVNGNLYFTAENILNNTIRSPTRFLEIFTKKTKNYFPFWHCNYLAGFCVLSIPVIIGLIFTDKRRWKFFWIITFGLAIITLYTAESRGGYLGFTVFLFLLLIVILNIKKLPYKKSMLLAIIAIFAVILINDRFRNTLVESVFKFNFATMEARVPVWNTGMKIGVSNPVLGNGIGTHSLLYKKFWNGNGLPEIYQLYSTPITIFTELGLVGIVLWGSIFFLGIYCWIRLLRSKEVDKKEKILTTAFIFSFISYTATSLVDYQLSIYPISGSLAIILACIIASHDRHSKQDTKSDVCSYSKDSNHFVCKTIKKILSVVLIVCFVFMAWYQYKDFMARKNFKLAVDSFYKNNNLAEAEKKVNIALEWQPKNFGFLNNLSSMLINASKHVGGKEKEFFADKAIMYLKKSIKLQKYQTYPYDVLGWIYLDKNPQKAENYFQEALYMSPINTGTFWGLGLSCLKQNKKQKAIKAFALEFLISPETVLFVDGYNTIKFYPEILKEVSERSKFSRIKGLREGKIKNILLNKLFFNWWCNKPFGKILTEIDRYGDNTLIKGSNNIVDLFNDYLIHNKKPAPHLLCYEAYLTMGSEKREKMIERVLQESKVEYDLAAINVITTYLNRFKGEYLSLIKSSIFNKSIPIITRIKNYPNFNLIHNNFDAPVLYGVYGFRCNLLVFIALKSFFSMTPEAYLSGEELREIIKAL